MSTDLLLRRLGAEIEIEDRRRLGEDREEEVGVEGSERGVIVHHLELMVAEVVVEEEGMGGDHRLEEEDREEGMCIILVVVEVEEEEEVEAEATTAEVRPQDAQGVLIAAREVRRDEDTVAEVEEGDDRARIRGVGVRDGGEVKVRGMSVVESEFLHKMRTSHAQARRGKTSAASRESKAAESATGVKI